MQWKTSKKTPGMIPKGMLCSHWANGFERITFTHLLGSGERPQPCRLLQLTNSKAPSWHRLWAVSFVSCNPSPFLPPSMPNRSFGKRKKTSLSGFQLLWFFFFSPPSQVSSYLNELLCLLNLLCLALQAEGFPFFSCREKTSRGGWGRCITSSLARRWDNGPAQVGLRGTGLLSLWPRRSWPWHRWPSAVCSRTPFLETPTVWDDHSSHGELSSPWTREKETQKGQSSAVCLLRHKHMAELCQWSSRCSKQL